MAELYLIFQSGNETATNRFRGYLSRHGWQRLSTGVYLHLDKPDFDQQAFWQHAHDEFAFDPERDFFAVFRAEYPFIPTRKYYNKPAPPWPIERPFQPEEDN